MHTESVRAYVRACVLRACQESLVSQLLLAAISRGGSLRLAQSRRSLGRQGIGFPNHRMGGPGGSISWPISWGPDKSPGGAEPRTHHSALKKQWGRYQPIIPDTQSLTGPRWRLLTRKEGRVGVGVRGGDGGWGVGGGPGIIWRSLMSILQIQ